MEPRIQYATTSDGVNIAYAGNPQYTKLLRIQAMRALINRHRPLYPETLAHVGAGWSAGEHARRAAELMREAYSRETLKKIYAAGRPFDIGDHWIPRERRVPS